MTAHIPSAPPITFDPAIILYVMIGVALLVAATSLVTTLHRALARPPQRPRRRT